VFAANNPGRWRSVFFYVLGGAPFAAVLLLYNWTIFGSPFAFPYGSAAFTESAGIAGQGLFGFPTLSNAYLILFSPSRGLFFTAPVLVLCVAAFLTSRDRSTLRHKVRIAAIAVSVVAMCGYGAAHGGWASATRYLVLILPLLLDSFFDGEIYDFSNVWQGLLFTVSFILCTLPVLTFPFAPPEFKYPHANFWMKLMWDEGWFTPNLANAFGLPPVAWTSVPVVLGLIVVFYIVWRYARRPARFFAGAVAGLLLVAGYLALPNLDASAENGFRRAVIAERHFRPAGRMERFADSPNLQRVRDSEWLIADARAYAPDDFPYLPTRDRSPSPTTEIKRAADLQQSSDLAGAESALAAGKDRFPFARCEFSTNLAVIYQATERLDAATAELESVQNLVNPASRPECLRSQFLLGTLYRETGRPADADRVFRQFLSNTAESQDPQIKLVRRQLGAN
jgi:hypothetical protein